MAELEIDQSNLPRVQEVCQSFAVLEDGVLAHSLQEQEIEQYYTTNVQKNQLVQNDIRMAKRMQDEEEEQRAQQSAFFRQASRQIEERDLEYARIVQEELLRSAEEVQKRELHDAEIAKRLQDEEEQQVRRRNSRREHTDHDEGSSSEPELLLSHQRKVKSLHRVEGEYSPPTSRERHCSFDSSPERIRAQEHGTSWSNQGHIQSIRRTTDESSHEDSDNSDFIYNQQLSVWSRRLYEGFNTAPPRQTHGKMSRQSSFRSSFSRVFDKLPKQTEDKGRGSNSNHDQVIMPIRHQGLGRSLKREADQPKCENQQRSDGLTELMERRRSHSQSVRSHDPNQQHNRSVVRTWSYKSSPEKRVSFQKVDSVTQQKQQKNSQVWEMLGHILRERGVPVKIGGSGAPLQIRPQSRDSQTLHGNELSNGDSQPHQRAFQRAATTRHSFHGYIRERRRPLHAESSRDHREAPDRHHDNRKASEIFTSGNSQRQGSRKWKEPGHTNNDHYGVMIPDHSKVWKTVTEGRHQHRRGVESFSFEVEGGEEDLQRRGRRALQHSQSLCSSRAPARRRSRLTTGGASVEPDRSDARLDLGELRQVLRDEELARKLQEEEEKLLRRNSRPTSGNFCPDNDFRVAQVAQDEEIARYMQKQEIKSKRRSRELEGPGSWREHRVMISQQDRQAAKDRGVQRERLDSEGLHSPTEDCSPDFQPPSPSITTPNAAQSRNIAEELDPTFQARRQDSETPQGQMGPACGSPPASPSDSLEEPTFIPPTKRQAEKPGRAKHKPKRENCKQQ